MCLCWIDTVGKAAVGGPSKHFLFQATRKVLLEKPFLMGLFPLRCHFREMWAMWDASDWREKDELKPCPPEPYGPTEGSAPSPASVHKIIRGLIRSVSTSIFEPNDTISAAVYWVSWSTQWLQSTLKSKVLSMGWRRSSFLQCLSLWMCELSLV